MNDEPDFIGDFIDGVWKGIGIVAGKRLANAAADRAAKDFEYEDKM